MKTTNVWEAYREEGGLSGYGNTEDEAIEDLKSQGGVGKIWLCRRHKLGLRWEKLFDETPTKPLLDEKEFRFQQKKKRYMSMGRIDKLSND